MTGRALVVLGWATIVVNVVVVLSVTWAVGAAWWQWALAGANVVTGLATWRVTLPIARRLRDRERLD